VAAEGSVLGYSKTLGLGSSNTLVFDRPISLSATGLDVAHAVMTTVMIPMSMALFFMLVSWPGVLR
jgi:hypothetical protein